MPAEKTPRAEAAAVPTTCRALSPSSLPGSLLSFSAFHHQPLGDSAVQVQFSCEASQEKKKKKRRAQKQREKINFLSGRVKAREKR